MVRVSPPWQGDSSVTDAIVVEGLERTFGNTRAVDGVNLNVPPGEIYGFLGPNGAGKSTMLKVLCTLITPTGGTARVAGYDVVREPKEVRLRIGAALQEASLDPNQTGTELLVLQGRLYGLSNAEIDERVKAVSAMIDIGDALDHRIKTYSGGMRRRLDLGAALVHRPMILFLDEPTTGLDPASRARVWEEVRRLHEDGMTIFLTTQYLEEADSLADRVGIIDHGKIIAEGKPSDLKQALGSDVIVAVVSPGTGEQASAELERIAGVERVERHGDELTIVTPNASTMLSAVAVALEGCGVVVQNLTMRTPTLDDVFLELTGAHIGRDEADEETTE
ncbi:MAG: ATP-binding cassette domain-containing protein [Acidimicrobiia bacterium]|nr:ATP-binding cassette domain-containing protein [Acidimicrobiia bacterium]